MKYCLVTYVYIDKYTYRLPTNCTFKWMSNLCVYHTIDCDSYTSLTNKNGIKDNKTKPYRNKSGEKARAIS